MTLAVHCDNLSKPDHLRPAANPSRAGEARSHRTSGIRPRKSPVVSFLVKAQILLAGFPEKKNFKISKSSQLSTLTGVGNFNIKLDNFSKEIISCE